MSLRKLLALFPLLAFFLTAQPAAKTETKPAPLPVPRVIDWPDALGWKRIQAPVVSPDGLWMAYQLVPNEGDSEVIVREVKTGKDQKFAIGEIPTPAGPGPMFGEAGPRNVQFSDDGKWLAFASFPIRKDAAKLKKERKPLPTKWTLVELATGKKTEFERVRRFAFSGERGGWAAILRSAAEGQKWSGSDLLLQELATGQQLNIGNVAEFAFNKKGDWLAFAIDAQDSIGNGLQLRSMATGAVLPLDSAKATYKSVTWTEEGDGLAVLRGVEDKSFEDKLYSVIAFKNFAGATPEKTVFDPKDDKSFPAKMTVSPNRAPVWTKNLSALVFGIHELKAKKKDDKKDETAAAPRPPAAPGAGPGGPPADDKDRADLVLWHWRDRRLQAQQQVEESRDKNFNYLSLYWVAEKKFVRLADEQTRQVTVPEPHHTAIGVDINPYELKGSLDGRRYQDLYAINLQTGDKKLAVKQNRWYYGASPDGQLFAYYDDGHFFVYDLAKGESRNVTKAITATSFINTEDDHNVSKPPTRFLGWSSDSAWLLISDNFDLWKVPVGAGKAVNLTGNGKKDQIRYNRVRLDPEEKGIDFAKPVYLSAYGEWTKKSGFARLDPQAKAPKMLLWEDASYGQLLKAKKADAYFLTRETASEYPNYHATNADLASPVKLTDANPQQKDFYWSSGVRLIDYTNAKGVKLQGALFLPANYEAGKSYPTVVYIYERLSQGLHNYQNPGVGGGFNRSIYNSAGYAVLMPDIRYVVNDPGMSAVWSVVPAVEAAVATGIVDRARVGIQGHSWGGYQTAFLVTQTKTFKAAVAGAPLTDMVSMYSSIYWNTGSANQPIFESSQGRFTGGYWEIPEAYIRNSPVYHARNVETPLMILHNDKDGAVDFTQGIEYFNTLRRLEKPVILLQYKGENHGLRKPENMKDYAQRMREFFDHHLMGKPAPNWLTEGVPHLKLKDHLDERGLPAARPVPTPEAPKPSSITTDPAN
jgi:dipeptidyl aminopeptidase/acylaminoacyl peptidase